MTNIAWSLISHVLVIWLITFCLYLYAKNTGFSAFSAKKKVKEKEKTIVLLYSGKGKLRIVCLISQRKISIFTDPLFLVIKRTYANVFAGYQENYCTIRITVPLELA